MTHEEIVLEASALIAARDAKASSVVIVDNRKGDFTFKSSAEHYEALTLLFMAVESLLVELGVPPTARDGVIARSLASVRKMRLEVS